MGNGSGVDSWWKRQRKVRVDAATAHIIGNDAARQQGADGIDAQSFQIATAVRQWFDSGYEPMNMIRMLLSGAVFMAENTGVSREQLVEVIRAAGMGADRQLILKP